MIKGCYTPTSYRAFIPKSLDSEYKEYERLCKEEVGQVLYAKPVQDVRSGAKLEDMFLFSRKIELGKFISIIVRKRGRCIQSIQSILLCLYSRLYISHKLETSTLHAA